MEEKGRAERNIAIAKNLLFKNINIIADSTWLTT
ncbi:hypothetical protein MC5_02135 [Rickettsia australis str. Cutlack]|uniref:Uncharacterized protein n=1 Tax=Rickettsia australis (strain Cutlack) TaxID=1105110 RepID=H8K9T9_RICAC|nr:hypothetical protein MC5_02135 [Rickettsia australis str. Cutlack]